MVPGNRTTYLDLSVLGWYIPGLSELPLGDRLLSLLGGPFQRVFVFSISPGTFIPFSLFPFFLVSFRVRACTPKTAPRATVAGVTGWWRVEGGLQGARSPFWWLGVACASRHDRCMNGSVWPPDVVPVVLCTNT